MIFRVTICCLALMPISCFVESICGQDVANATPERSADSGNATILGPWAERAIEKHGSKYGVFNSTLAGTRVSYQVFLPEEYDSQPLRRYPVVYWLHGSGGSQYQARELVDVLRPAIRAGDLLPIIVVGVNGRKKSGYTDAKDGNSPVQSVIVKELIPHIDSSFRTIAQREGRAIAGFSMGGTGAAKIGLGHPDLFGAVSILASGMDTVERHKKRGSSFQEVYGNDAAYYNAQSPFTLATKNAAKIRENSLLRILVGEHDSGLERNRKFHELLGQKHINHEFRIIENAGHSSGALYAGATKETIGFYHTAFANIPTSNSESGPESGRRARLLVTTDIGGDPDDQQSMIRLMLYSNEFEIAGLVASSAGTPGELKESVVRPELIRQIVEAYGEARPRLVKHAENWPEAKELLSKIKSGNANRGRKAIGQGHDTEGSKWIIRQVDSGSTQRLLNIAIWGGQTDLAQALFRVRADRGAEGLAAFVQRFRVYDVADQDGLASWMMAEFPGMHYILSAAEKGRDRREAAFRGMYLSGDESLTSRAWVTKHILSSSQLGALYPTKTWTMPNPHGCMKEGDTPSWFFFLPLGGNNPDDPTHAGWGGRFRKTEQGWYRDTGLDNDPRHTVSRWREDFQADFARRLEWCREG